MLGRRRRRRANIKTTLGQRFVFSGMPAALWKPRCHHAEKQSERIDTEQLVVHSQMQRQTLNQCCLKLGQRRRHLSSICPTSPSLLGSVVSGEVKTGKPECLLPSTGMCHLYLAMLEMLVKAGVKLDQGRRHWTNIRAAFFLELMSL